MTFASPSPTRGPLVCTTAQRRQVGRTGMVGAGKERLEEEANV